MGDRDGRQFCDVWCANCEDASGKVADAEGGGNDADREEGVSSQVADVESAGDTTDTAQDKKREQNFAVTVWLICNESSHTHH